MAQPRLTVDGAASCQDREWSVRGVVQGAHRHSEWVSTGEYNTPTLKAPPRPDRDKPSSWLQSAATNSYNLRFAWKDSSIRCWSNTTHQVQRRQYESGVGWSAWTTLPDKTDNARFHEESFAGTKSHEFRGRAQNQHGWSRWLKRLLFVMPRHYSLIKSSPVVLLDR